MKMTLSQAVTTLARQRHGQAAQLRRVARDINGMRPGERAHTAIGRFFEGAKPNDGMDYARVAALTRLATLAHSYKSREMRQIARDLCRHDFNPLRNQRPLLDFIHRVNPDNRAFDLLRALSAPLPPLILK